MKIGQFLKKMVGGAMVLTALACPVFTSCYNDAALWDEIEGIHGDVATLEQKLAALEAKLNTDLQALKTLLEGQISKLEGKVDALVTVKDVKENTDGSVTVTLSDNTEFTVHPKFEQDYTALVTTTTIDGVLYWAVFDENGKAVAVTDAEGDLVPVVDVVPQVRINPETALVEISFDGGTTWQEVGYNEPCVFEGVEVVYTDNYTDEEEANYGFEETPMYVVITLPDGNTISVTFDGAASFMFGGHMGNVGTTQYVSCGTTVDVGFMTTNITEWIKEVPAGWKVEEIAAENAQYGGASFRITAPTEEQVASGAAAAEGQLKVLAVAEGGKNVTASLKLTTKAFNQFVAGKGTVTIEMNNGLGGYVVGVSTVADFDPEAIVAELKPLIEAIVESPWGSYPDWPYNNTDYDYFEQSVSDYEIANLVAIPEMVLGEQYVVWALAVNYWQDANYNFGYTAGSIYSVNYNNVSIELEATKLAFNDIQISAKFEGIESYYGAFSLLYSEELNKEGILAEFNSGLTASWGAPEPLLVNDEYIVGWDNGLFTGSPVTLVDGNQSIEPGNTYYMYLIPAVEGKTSYSMSEVYWFEFTTPDLTSGGAVKVTADDPTATYSSIIVPLSAENASYIYYAWVETAKVSTIADKAAYLLENAVRAASSSVDARTPSYGLTLKPGMDAVLLAFAVDANGAYGEVFEKTFTTKAIEYNTDVTFDLAIEGDVAETAKVKVSVTGAPEGSKYHYQYFTKGDYRWTDNWGGTEESASAYFVTAYSAYYTTLNTLPEGGLIELTGLDEYGEYVFVISSSSTDENGETVFSKAKVLEFERTLNLGTIVSAKDDNGNDNATWVAAKPDVQYTLDSVGDDSSVTWTVSDLPEGWTGFTAVVDSEYTAAFASDKDLITFLVLNEYDWATKYDLVNGETYSKHWLYTANYDLYVVLVDPEGNYYAPYKWNFDATAGGFGVM